MEIYDPTKWCEVDKKLVYLAGPTSNGWQQQAVEALNNEQFAVANPSGSANNEDPALQTSWELYHIRLASATGAIFFWLPKDCDDATVIFQLGEWLQNLKYRRIYEPERPIKLFLGIEPGCKIEQYILFRVFDEIADFKVFDNIKTACEEIIKAV